MNRISDEDIAEIVRLEWSDVGNTMRNLALDLRDCREQLREAKKVLEFFATYCSNDLPVGHDACGGLLAAAATAKSSR